VEQRKLTSLQLYAGLAKQSPFWGAVKRLVSRMIVRKIIILGFCDSNWELGSELALHRVTFDMSLMYREVGVNVFSYATDDKDLATDSCNR
jgi:hypothetical protein